MTTGLIMMLDSINVEVLLGNVRRCEACLEHLPHGVRPVVQVDSQARILIAGQAPGSKVHASGVPFDDQSGDRLRLWMGVDKEVFYDPTKVAILPMGFCYPGTGKSGDLPPRKECAELWRKQLLDCMPNIKLTLVIGQYALRWHLPEMKGESLTSTVKSWGDFWPRKLPLPHPSPRNNIWLKKNQWFENQVLPELQAQVQNVLQSGD